MANKTGDSVTEINAVIQDMCGVSETMVQTLKDIGSSMTSVRSAATEIDTSLSDQLVQKSHKLKKFIDNALSEVRAV